MKKECQFILFPTEKISQIYIQHEKLYFEKYPVRSIYAGNQFLYILSDDEIKEGDKCYDKVYNRIVIAKSIKENFVSIAPNLAGLKHSNISNLKKIIATTDSELHKSYVSVDDVCKPDCTLLPKISQSDIEYIINLYNEKDKEVNFEKYLIERAQQYAIDSGSNSRSARSKGFIDGYNQCSQDNADKRFTLEDIRAIVRKSIYLKGGFDKEGFSFYKDDNEIMDECIQSLTKEQSNNNTLMVEYESDGLPSKQIKIGDVDLTEFNDNPYKPKLKDGSIVVHQ